MACSQWITKRLNASTDGNISQVIIWMHIEAANFPAWFWGKAIVDSLALIDTNTMLMVKFGLVATIISYSMVF